MHVESSLYVGLEYKSGHFLPQDEFGCRPVARGGTIQPRYNFKDQHVPDDLEIEGHHDLELVGRPRAAVLVLSRSPQVFDTYIEPLKR